MSQLDIFLRNLFRLSQFVDKRTSKVCNSTSEEQFHLFSQRAYLHFIKIKLSSFTLTSTMQILSLALVAAVSMTEAFAPVALSSRRAVASALDKVHLGTYPF